MNFPKYDQLRIEILRKEIEALRAESILKDTQMLKLMIKIKEIKKGLDKQSKPAEICQ